MAVTSVKDAARRLVDRLPDGATWDDLEYEIYVRRAIEAGIADSDIGAVDSVADVRKSYGFAARLLAEVAAEDDFDRNITATASQLAKLSDAALAEYEAGETMPLDEKSHV